MDNNLIQPALIVAAALVLSTAVVHRHGAAMTAFRQPGRAEQVAPFAAEAHAEGAIHFGAGASIGLATERTKGSGLDLSNLTAPDRLLGAAR
ncbi:MAG TPA: hypothetical protein VMJ70_07000 [Candidatus Sulfotelmatobacter sp.]|nr:hypothetical protein [Candidatus Sulfotelmatobacter sp.]